MAYVGCVEADCLAHFGAFSPSRIRAPRRCDDLGQHLHDTFSQPALLALTKPFDVQHEEFPVKHLYLLCLFSALLALLCGSVATATEQPPTPVKPSGTGQQGIVLGQPATQHHLRPLLLKRQEQPRPRPLSASQSSQMRRRCFRKVCGRYAAGRQPDSTIPRMVGSA